MFINRLRAPLINAACFLFLVVLLCGSALAQKKPATSIPPAPGTIYFHSIISGGSYGDSWSMNGDGSAKKQAMFGEPSHAQLGGARWFLDVDYVWDGPLDEQGIPPAGLFAMNERDGSRRQLTEFSGSNWPNDWADYFTWAKDDSFVSFVTDTYNADGSVTTKLFTMEVDWSLDGPVAGALQLVLEENVGRHYDWSPAGDQLVYGILNAVGVRQLYVASFTTAGVQTRFLATGQDPTWSSLGDRIAFSNNGIYTIKPDGSGAMRLTQPVSSKTERRSHGSPSWSPDGLFLAFGESVVRNNGSYSGSVLRIPAAGGATVNLTSDVGNSADPKWRP